MADALNICLVSPYALAGGHPLSPAGAARLHEHTAGHPLHAQHVLDRVPPRVLAHGDGPLPAPAGVSAVIADRVAALSPAARRLRLTDAHNGLRALNRAAASGLKITMNGMAHASEIVAYLARSRLKVVEAPVAVRYTEYSRAKGQSLINGVNILFDLSLNRRSS